MENFWTLDVFPFMHLIIQRTFKNSGSLYRVVSKWFFENSLKIHNWSVTYIRDKNTKEPKLL